MQIIRDNIGVMGNSPEIAIYLLRNMKGTPLHSINIQCKDHRKLDAIHNKIFDVKKGMYVPSELGKQYNAFITSSSFTIGVKTTKIKQLANDLGIDTVRIVRYITM